MIANPEAILSRRGKVLVEVACPLWKWKTTNKFGLKIFIPERTC